MTRWRRLKRLSQSNKVEKDPCRWSKPRIQQRKERNDRLRKDGLDTWAYLFLIEGSMPLLVGSIKVSGHFIKAIFRVALSGSESVKYLIVHRMEDEDIRVSIENLQEQLTKKKKRTKERNQPVFNEFSKNLKAVELDLELVRPKEELQTGFPSFRLRGHLSKDEEEEWGKRGKFNWTFNKRQIGHHHHRRRWMVFWTENPDVKMNGFSTCLQYSSACLLICSGTLGSKKHKMALSNSSMEDRFVRDVRCCCLLLLV